MRKRLTTEEFIAKAVAIHGNKYDYTESVYTYAKTKVFIKCAIHGTFKQTPDCHVSGRGCSKCGDITIHEKQKRSRENTINAFTQIHGNVYDYSKTIYINNTTNICIICKQHGDFYQTPKNHLKGYGCPTCGIISGSKNRTKSTNQFIQKSVNVHGTKYNYTKTIYTSARTKTCITCNAHGDFWQSPNSHLRGVGCPVCKSSKGELCITNFLIKHEYVFIYQHKFSDCKRKYSLPFDFYIPSLNVCIEYDGEFHYRTWANSTEPKHINKLKQIKIADSIKTAYCKENGIRLIRIPFWDFNNINTILENIL